MTTSAVPQSPFARAAGAIIALAALMASMLITAAPADAHARLEGSSPQDGATLSAAPPEIMLRFNEPIQEGLNQVTVKSGSTDVADGDPQVDGSDVHQPVEYTMEPGEYTVTYKVVSADGHPVSGSFSFTYEPAEGDGKVEDDADEGQSATESDESASPSQEPSETTSPEESQADPSETTSADSQDEAGTDATDEAADEATEGTSPWWWALAAVALIVVIGGLWLLVRGRRDAEDEDDKDDKPLD